MEMEIVKEKFFLNKREAEKETPEDLKQAFRVFDKVANFLLCIKAKNRAVDDCIL